MLAVVLNCFVGCGNVRCVFCKNFVVFWMDFLVVYLIVGRDVLNV